MDSPFEDLPPLPEQIYLLNGETTALTPNAWFARTYKNAKSYKFDWSAFDFLQVNGINVYDSRSHYLIKLYTAHRLRHQKAGTAHSDYLCFLDFGRWLIHHARSSVIELNKNGFSWSSFNERLAQDYIYWSRKHRAHKDLNFVRLRKFYEWGVAWQYNDFDLKTYLALKSISVIAHAKGQLVRSRNPIQGPFSTEEKSLIIRAIKTGKGNLEDRAIVALCLELGPRAVSITRLTNAHFKKINSQKGVLYQLDVPSSKKRSVEEISKRRPISFLLGTLLESLISKKAEAPLFHLTDKNPEKTLNNKMKQFALDAEIISHRTGKIINLNPRRFRYTLATHLAEEGASKFHIAEILDHADLQNVEVYIETSPSIADQIAKATDTALKPIVNRFLGKVVDSFGELSVSGLESQLILGTATHIPLPVLPIVGVGACGRDTKRDGLCRLFPPLSCYLCPSFVALKSGAHREQLDAIEKFISTNKGEIDNRILIQLDEIRLAIHEVLDGFAGENPKTLDKAEVLSET